MIDQLNFLYEAGVTRRFHTVPVIHHQNIADHSWHVAMLAHVLYGQDEPGLRMTFIMACLTHDMAECKVGDLPAPAKRNMEERFPNFRESWGEMEQHILQAYSMDWEKFLTEEEKRRLKLCDALEGMFYCISERWLGNRSIVVCFNNFSSYVGALLEDVGDVPFNKDDLTPDEAATYREWDAFNLALDFWGRAGE
jgi:5'-deoxynucleotidase YfbR-like HD superfamily hydrolase